MLFLPMSWQAFYPYDIATLRFWVTLFTHQIGHAGIFHLLGNYVFMIPYALFVEHKIGKIRFIAFWFLSGLFAAGLQFIINGPGGLIGSSGVAFAMLTAACYMFNTKLWQRILACIVSLVVVGGEFVVALTTQSDGIAHWAHIGGAAGGLILIHLFSRSTTSRSQYHPERRLL